MFCRLGKQQLGRSVANLGFLDVGSAKYIVIFWRRFHVLLFGYEYLRAIRIQFN